MAEPLIIIDHLIGTRRGRRQSFALTDIVRFGRHPDSDVCFHAHRDLDASSRHAELSPALSVDDLAGSPAHPVNGSNDRLTGDSPEHSAAGAFVLRDVGSSNGTFVDGHKVIELSVDLEQPLLIEFGEGGPRVRLFIGDPDALPPIPRVNNRDATMTHGDRLALLAILTLIVGLAVLAWVMWV